MAYGLKILYKRKFFLSGHFISEFRSIPELFLRAHGSELTNQYRQYQFFFVSDVSNVEQEFYHYPTSAQPTSQPDVNEQQKSSVDHLALSYYDKWKKDDLAELYLPTRKILL